MTGYNYWFSCPINHARYALIADHKITSHYRGAKLGWWQAALISFQSIGRILSHPLRIAVIRYYVSVIKKILQVMPGCHGTYYIISAGQIIVCYTATIIRVWLITATAVILTLLLWYLKGDSTGSLCGVLWNPCVRLRGSWLLTFNIIINPTPPVCTT